MCSVKTMFYMSNETIANIQEIASVGSKIVSILICVPNVNFVSHNAFLLALFPHINPIDAINKEVYIRAQQLNYELI